MKRWILATCFLLMMLKGFCQKLINDPNAEVRNVNGFHAIEVSSAIALSLSQDDQEAVAVSADDPAYVKHIETRVENGVLKIWYNEKGKWWKSRKLKAYVSVRTLDGLNASGASDVKIVGSIGAENLTIHCSGASDLKGELHVSGDLEVHLTGASDININGTANNINIHASGASDVKGYDFQSATCSVDASGASDVHITVEKEISANLSGASGVDYKGNAVIKDVHSTGASSLSHKG